MSWLYAISMIGFVSTVVRALVAAAHATPSSASRSRRTDELRGADA